MTMFQKRCCVRDKVLVRLLSIVLLPATLCFLAAAGTSTVEVFVDFPGGNIRVDSIVGNTVYLRPDLRDTTRDWFYWYMGVRSSRSGVVRFVFNQPNCISGMGPALSTDKGKSWKWLWATPANRNEFEYDFSAGKQVRFSMGMPYTSRHLSQFLGRYKKNERLHKGILCRSEGGEVTEQIVIRTAGKGQPKLRVLVTARHHACEMMASYALEGMIEALLRTDREIASFMEQFEFVFIPFMDKSGVEKGDQGKARFPRDHNRDYSGQSIYESTKELRSRFTGNIVAALDLHCPMLKGRDNESLYLVGQEDIRLKQNFEDFADRFIACSTGPLRLDRKRVYISKGGYPEGASFGEWAAALPSVRLVCTLEVPYALHYEEAITPEKLRILGNDMVYALKDFLSNH